MSMLDLLVRNASLPSPEPAGARFDVGIARGKIASIALASANAAPARETLDAAGRLLSGSFANPHLHLCKVWTLDMLDEAALADYHGAGMARALSAIELASRVKDRYRADWIIDHARRAVALAALHGNLHIRAFADVDHRAGLEAVEALIAVREEFRGVVEIQVCAFPQEGILREDGAQDLMEQAMEMGCDVVGGIPWIEFSDEAALEHVKICFDLAQRYRKDVSMLLDDAGDATLRTLEMMALEAVRTGWEGRALAHHCRAMALYPTPYLQRLSGLLRQARISVVSDPHTGPLHARVSELREAGVRVVLGQDDISDAYYPFGRNNMMEVAFLASHMLWMTKREEIETLFGMVTHEAAAAMNVAGGKVEAGAPAHLVLHAHGNVLETLRYHEWPRAVVSHGKLLDLAELRSRAGLHASG